MDAITHLQVLPVRHMVGCASGPLAESLLWSGRPCAFEGLGRLGGVASTCLVFASPTFLMYCWGQTCRSLMT